MWFEFFLKLGAICLHINVSVVMIENENRIIQNSCSAAHACYFLISR